VVIYAVQRDAVPSRRIEVGRLADARVKEDLRVLVYGRQGAVSSGRKQLYATYISAVEASRETTALDAPRLVARRVAPARRRRRAHRVAPARRRRCAPPVASPHRRP